MRLFKSDIVEWVLNALRLPDDHPIENKRVSSSIASAQEQVEAQNFDIRKNILKYDDVMNRQRHRIYGDRRRVLEGADVSEQLRETVDGVVQQYVIAGTTGFAEDWDLEQLWTQMKTLYPVSLKRADYEDEDDLDRDELIADFQEDARRAYDAREQELGSDVMRELERQVMLTVLDRKWREHLYEMDYLREGIGLRAMAQKDPLVEYQREGGEMYAQMMEAFKEEVVGYLYHLEVEVQRGPAVGVVAGADGQPVEVGAGARSGSGGSGSGRNGSGGDGGSGNMRPLAQRRAPVIESGPDPDGPGVEVSTHEEPDPETSSRPQISGKGLASANGRSRQQQQLAYKSSNGQSKSGAATRSNDPYANVGRNQPCPCGSGKKFKMCHGAGANLA
ncbi:hypothetical protein GCM10027613_48120 [Microlunatus endophyticus]